MTIEELRKKFNSLQMECMANYLSGNNCEKLSDEFYNLCKEFVNEVDENYTEAKEAEYEAISKSGNTRILEDC